MSQEKNLFPKAYQANTRAGSHLRSVGLIATFVVLLLVALFWLLSAPISRAQASFYVVPGGTGSSCSQSVPCDIHTAVSLAADGDEVRVAAGTYTRLTPGSTVVLTLSQSISLTGGYNAGDWSAPPDPDFNLTTLDGEDNASVILINNNASPTVENFSIVNGSAQLFGGGGIYVASGNPTIRFNRIYSNTAVNNPGGGIYDVGGATIQENDIFGNKTTSGGSGGGIAVENNGNLTTITLNELYNNDAAGSGGGVLVGFNANAFLEANRVYNNQANNDGGGLNALGPTTLYSNLVYTNTAGLSGGGLGLGSNANLWNNTVVDNLAAQGGGIVVFGTITVSNSIIAFNGGGTNTGIDIQGGAVSGAYNNVFNNGLDAGVNFTNPITGNPDFVNPGTGNYHINQGSPNLDAGDPNTPAAVDMDIDGRPRPDGPAIDVGADEYEPGFFNATLTPGFLQDFADRGSLVPYNHLLENTGTAQDTYTITCSNSLGWSVSCPGQVTLFPGDNQTINTDVTIPAAAVALSQGTTIITASSQLSPTLQPRAVVQTTVNPRPGVAFTPNYSDTVLPGDIITFTHIITNVGDALETFTLEKIGGDWAELIPRDSYEIQLASGSSQAIQVRITVPPEAPAGLADTTVIRASSNFDPSIFAEVTDEVVARPTIGTRYVAFSASTDQDNNCTQSATPCRTVGHAVGQASSGDEVRIAAGGPFVESDIPLNDTIFISGGWTAGYTNQLEPDATVIDANGTTLILNIAPGSAVQPTISNLTLTGGNNSGPGGAVLVGNGAQPQFEQVIFRQNQGTRGGAIFVGTNAFVIVRQSHFLTNMATNSGGAIYVSGGNLSLQQSTLMTNTAPTGAGLQGGGALYLSGGILDATNNLFRGNDTGSDGGAIYISSSTPGGVTLLNNTFYQNNAGDDGGAVFNDAAANVTIMNALLINNNAGSEGGAVYQVASSGSASIAYSDLWQNSTPETVDVSFGTGNLSVDPGFIDSQLRLGRGSPVLDVANPDPAVSPPVDFEDDARPADAGFDMGYDELAGCRAQRVGIAEPFGSIQEAMAADVPGTLIRVTGICRGVNQRTDPTSGQPISQTVFITRSFTIQGGWNTDFTEQTGSDTIIDPEGAGRAFFVSGNLTTTLEYLIVVNGDAAGLGGGPAAADAGGGLFIGNGLVNLLDMRILTNTAAVGGGIYNHSGNVTFRSTPVEEIVNPFSRVGNNQASQDGGGIYNNQGQMVLGSLRIYRNSANLGGGYYASGQASTLITNTAFYSNSASSLGGGIYNAGSGGYWHLTLFSNEAGGDGGGFYNIARAPNLRNNIFQSNRGSNGPAIFVGGGDPGVDYNYYHDHSGTAVVNPDPNDDQNSIFDDVVPPGLQDPLGENFHLLDNGAAVDQGTLNSSITRDMDGQPRPSNQGPDMGADEVIGCLVQLGDIIYGSIQAAMLDAQPGATLRVAGICSGVHDFDTGNSGGGDCSGSNGIIPTTVHVDRQVNLQGGWNINFTDRDSVTYLDAQNLGRVIYVAPNITSTIEGFHIINGQYDNGAGICIDNAEPTIRGNQIYSNTATNNGSAVYSIDSQALIDANRIFSNDGVAGTVYGTSSGVISTTIQNNFVYSNTAADGAGLFNGAGNNNFWHNTIYNNNASSTGGAFYAAAGSPNFQNNIVISNTAGGEADGAYGAAGTTPVVSHNDFFGQADDFGGTIADGGPGHISVDPQFKNIGALDFTLYFTSPVVDVGATLPIATDFEVDIRPSHNGYDMGADEVGGCYVRLASDPLHIYGSIQDAIDNAFTGDYADVDGVCLGAAPRILTGTSQLITQTLFIDKDLTINGDWNYKTANIGVLNAVKQGRVVYVNTGRTVTLTNISLQRGDGNLGGIAPGGGGVWNDGNLIVIDSELLFNNAQLGGAIYNATNLTLMGTYLQGNRATNGGAFYNDTGSGTADLAEGNEFFTNTATLGGAVYQQDGILLLNGNKLYHNTATSDGGGVYLSGGTDDTVHVINNFLFDNSATRGGGIFNANTDALIWHNTVVANPGGGLVSNSTAGDSIHSNIFDSNFGPGIETVASNPDIDYNNVYNNLPNYGGTAFNAPTPNDISAAPIYDDPVLFDFHLLEISPGVDEADPNVSGSLTRDYDGDIRPTNQAPDMGADEYNSCLVRIIDPNTGTPTLFGVLQDAIDYAESFAGTAPLPTVEIARGACRGVQTRNGTNQVAYVSENLSLTGSLRRTNFSDPNDWNNINIRANSTVIDAQGEGRVLYLEAGTTVSLTHLALVNGNAYLANDGNNNGGGFYLNGPGHLETSESQACANYAENGGGYYFGSQATAYVTGASTGRCSIALFDTDDTFLEIWRPYPGNDAQNNGGAMHISNGAGVDVVNHSFRSNEAFTGDGGALFNADDQTRLINVFHFLNTAHSGNGGSVYNSGGMDVYHNTLMYNEAGNEGGAIYHNGSSFRLDSSIVYTNVTTGTTGGFFSNSGGGTLLYNLFYNNDPTDSNIGLGANAINRHPETFGGALSVYSPAIDKANPDLLLDSNTDPNGVWPGGIDFDAGNFFRPDVHPFYPDLNTNITGYASDIGADEYWKEFGCEVVPDTLNSTILPGDTVTYSVSIVNVGNPSKLLPNVISHGYTDSFTITLETSNPDWAISLEGDGTVTQRLDYYGVRNPDRVSAVLTVTVPATTTLGTQEVSRITCTSVSLPGRSATAVATTNVGEVSGIIVAPEYNTTARPGDVLTFTHYVTVTGNTPETVLLVPNAGASGLSTAELISTSVGITNLVDLNPGEFITAYLKVTILDTAIAGGTATPGLIGRSTLNQGVEGRAINQILILPIAGTRHVAGGGTDVGNNCTDPQQPCATLQHAISQAADGDHILMAAGTYTGLVTRTVGVDTFAQLAYVDKSVTIQGGYSVNDNPPFSTMAPITNSTVLDGEQQHRIFTLADGVTVTLSGLFLQNGFAYSVGTPDTQSDYGGGIYNAGANLTITSTWVLTSGARFGSGLYHIDGNLSVHSSVFAHGDSQHSGSGLAGSGVGIQIVTGTVLLENNTFASNTIASTSLQAREPLANGDGAAINQTDGSLTFYNNIFADNVTNISGALATVIFVDLNNVTPVNDFNLYYNNSGGTVDINFAKGVNSITGADPDFEDHYFHISAGSAAKDAGTNAVSSASGLDFELDPRPQGTDFDIGADERFQRPDFIFAPPVQSALVDANVAYTYTHYITNTGDFQNTFTLSYGSSSISGSGWQHQVSPSAPFTLNTDEGQKVTLVLTGTTAGDVDTTVITATPQVGSPATVRDTTIISFTADVDIAPDRSGNGGPGTSATYTHTLTNTGDGLAQFNIITATANPTGWTITIVPTQTGFLPVNGSTTFTVVVDIPPGTLAGTVHTVDVEAYSVVYPAVRDSLVDTTTVDAAYGVALAPDNVGSVRENSAITYTHTLTNNGNTTDSFTLSFQDVPAGWTTSVQPPTTGVLAPLATTLVTVVVSAPPGTVGQTHVVTITATSGGSGLTATAVNTTTVREQLGVVIEPDNFRLVDAGTTVTYTHIVTNTGDAADSYMLSGSSTQTWLTTLTPSSLNLAVGESAPVSVAILVPGGTAPGVVDVTTITVTSDTDGAVFDTATDTTRVRQPGSVLDVTITPDNSATGIPGDTLTYQHVVENTGNISGTFNLTAVSSQSWGISVTPTGIVDLLPGETQPVTVTVVIPGSATQGDQDVTTITVADVGGMVSDSAVNTTTVDFAQQLGVVMEPDNFATGLPGDTITHTHLVTNTGTLTDSYDLTAVSGRGWPVTVMPALVMLAPGEAAPVTVTTTIPGGTANGTPDTVVVTATSRFLSTITDAALDVTMVAIRSGGVEVAPDGQQSGIPGDTLFYQHVLTNTGNATHTFLLNVQSSRGWPISVTPLRHDSVAPGETRALTVTIAIPLTAANGDQDYASVVATSVLSSAITDLAINQTRVAISYGVEVEPDNSGGGLPGDTVTYQHVVTNTGNFTETFTLSTASNQNWTVTVQPSTITLGAGSSGPVVVQVTIPTGAIPGQRDTATLTATTTTPGTAVSDIAVDTTTVSGTTSGFRLYMPVIFGTPLANQGVAITPDNNGSSLAGNTLTYQHTVQNTGNSTESFTLNAASSQGWPVNVTPTSINNLSSGSTQAVQVEVTIPPGSAAGTVDVTTVTITNLGGTLSDSARDTTTVDAVSTVDVTITPDNTGTALPGGPATYQHTVTNIGNTAETFALTTSSGQGWSANVQPTSVSLGPGQSDTVNVTINIPLNATAGMVESTTVTVSSTTPGTTASDTATDRTTVACTLTNIDLIVTDIVLTPDPPLAGSPATVEVTIRNLGSVDMDPMNNFYLDFYVDRTPAYLLPGDIAWGVQAKHMKADTSYTLSATYTFSAGPHDIWAQVDTDDTVNECPFEDNNVLGPITIGSTGQDQNGDTGDTPAAPEPRTTPRPTPTPPAGYLEEERQP